MSSSPPAVGIARTRVSLSVCALVSIFTKAIVSHVRKDRVPAAAPDYRPLRSSRNIDPLESPMSLLLQLPAPS